MIRVGKGNLRYLKGGVAFSLEEAVRYCAQPGDSKQRHAVEFVYKQFYGYLFAVALRYVKNREDVEELVNESFVRAFAKIDTFKGAEETAHYENVFKGWLGRICAHVSIDFLRKKKDLYLLEDEQMEQMTQFTTSDTDQFEVHDMMKLLLGLPDIQRAIFNLYEIEGYSHEEIAEVLAIPASTSRTYLTRAKQRLRKIYLQAYPWDIKVERNGQQD